MVFCLPLVIGLVAVYISERSDSELAYLTTAVAAVSFLVSLVLLPWQLKILLLACVCLLARRQLTSVNRSEQSIEQSVSGELSAELTQQTIKRSLAEPFIVAEPEQELVGKYRGATWKATPGVELLETQIPIADLKYRGAPFWNQSSRP